MLQLHVWGPAFGLPSIDPNCLAAIAYLSQTVPQADWVLVASSDPTLSPSSPWDSISYMRSYARPTLMQYMTQENCQLFAMAPPGLGGFRISFVIYSKGLGANGI